MKKNIVLGILLVVMTSYYIRAQEKSSKPPPKIVRLDSFSPDSAQILDGPPETIGMYAGYMVLPPSHSVGKHSTRNNEEVLVVLSGSGEFKILGGITLQLKPYSVAYCPPHTEHDVTNTGADTLRYVYIVARTK